MPSGNTFTDSLRDSLPTVIMSARIVREYQGVMPNLVDRKTLGEGIGLTWNEVSYAQLAAQDISEATELNNPQQLSDTLFAITPTVTGIHTVITDRVAARITKNGYAKTGSLAQNAIQRKKDVDGLNVLDGATTSLSGAGTTLVSGVITAAVNRISGNATEPGMPPYRCVLHPFQIKDIHDEIVAGVGTYPIESGLTADTYKQFFSGMISSAQVYADGNLPIDSSTDDAKGGVFAEEAIVLVQGRRPRVAVVRNERLGGGATEQFHYDEYAYGERSAGNWLFEVFSDATEPTS